MDAAARELDLPPARAHPCGGPGCAALRGASMSRWSSSRIGIQVGSSAAVTIAISTFSEAESPCTRPRTRTDSTTQEAAAFPAAGPTAAVRGRRGTLDGADLHVGPPDLLEQGVEVGR